MPAPYELLVIVLYVNLYDLSTVEMISLVSQLRFAGGQLDVRIVCRLWELSLGEHVDCMAWVDSVDLIVVVVDGLGVCIYLGGLPYTQVGTTITAKV